MKKIITFVIVIILTCSMCAVSLAIDIEPIRNEIEEDSIENKEEQNQDCNDDINKGVKGVKEEKEEKENIIEKQKEENIEVEKENQKDVKKNEKTEKIEKQIIENGTYEICSSMKENLLINAENNKYADYTNVNLGKNLKLKRQRFNIKYDNEKESYIIKALNGNKVLDVNGGKQENGTNVQLYEYNGTMAQQWEIKKVDDNNYTIVLKNTNKCLDIKWRNY